MDEPRPENNAAPDQSALRIISPAPVTWKIKRVLWSVVQASFYRLTFQNWSAWRRFLLRLFGAKIGAQCTIRRTSRVYYPWLLEMSDLSCLGDDCVIYNLARVVIGPRATISQEAYLCAGTHDYTKLSMPLGDDPHQCRRRRMDLRPRFYRSRRSSWRRLHCRRRRHCDEKCAALDHCRRQPGRAGQRAQTGKSL